MDILNILDENTGKYISIPAIQGSSAYEVAVANGFTGTEEEWLVSLKGDGADVDMSDYATISYVDEAVSSIDVDTADINLDGYATEEYVENYINDNIEAISGGYYETVEMTGEDITADIVAENGELPMLPTYAGGTRYIVNNGIISMMVNTNVEEDSFYINDYDNSDINQNLIVDSSEDGNCADYLIYGAYNKDLLTKTNLMASAQSTMTKYANLNSLDGYYPSVEYANDGASSSKMCGWSFYGMMDGSWVDVRINSGSVSQNIQDQIDATGSTIYSSKYSNGFPQQGLYRKSPCVYFSVSPYTTYTINYTGDVDGDQDYMKGLHYKVLTRSPSGGGCWSGYASSSYTGGHTSDRTVTITTGSDAMFLCIFVGRVKTVNTSFRLEETDGSYTYMNATMASDSSTNISQEIVQYNINHLSVVEGAKTYEYYIEMIKNIPFTLSITAMSVMNDSEYEYYELTIPYIMASNQYFRYERDKEMYAVARPLQKAVNMHINELNDTYLNYEVGVSDVCGKWIDSKDIYKLVLKLDLTSDSSNYNSGTSFYEVSISLPDAVDTIVNFRVSNTYDSPVTGNRLFTTGYSGYTSATRFVFRSIDTIIPDDDDDETPMYSTMLLAYPSYWASATIVIVLEYTRYEMDDDGNIT